MKKSTKQLRVKTLSKQDLRDAGGNGRPLTWGDTTCGTCWTVVTPGATTCATCGDSTEGATSGYDAYANFTYGHYTG